MLRSSMIVGVHVCTQCESNMTTGLPLFNMKPAVPAYIQYEGWYANSQYEVHASVPVSSMTAGVIYIYPG